MYTVLAYDYELQEVQNKQFENEFIAYKCASGLWKAGDKYRFVELSKDGFVQRIYGNNATPMDIAKMLVILDLAVEKYYECLQLCDY